MDRERNLRYTPFHTNRHHIHIGGMPDRLSSIINVKGGYVVKKIKINKICSLALIVCVLMQGMCYPLPAGAADPERTGWFPHGMTKTINTMYARNAGLHGKVCLQRSISVKMSAN